MAVETTDKNVGLGQFYDRPPAKILAEVEALDGTPISVVQTRGSGVKNKDGKYWPVWELTAKSRNTILEMRQC